MYKDIYKKTERLLKSALKEKRRLTATLIITYLMTGAFASSNDAEIINIQAPNTNGISHNKVKDFSINKDENKIFNNSKENKVSEITKKEIQRNTNFKDKEADIIITEVEGRNKTNLEGILEVLGKKADVIIANQNGISINGQKFINANSVTLTTGKYDGSNFNPKNKEDIKNHFLNPNNSVDVKNIGIFGTKLNLHGNNKILTFTDKDNNLLVNASTLNIENGDDIYFNLGKNKTRKRRSLEIDSDGEIKESEISIPILRSARTVNEGVAYETVDLEDEELEEDTEDEEAKKKKEEARRKEDEQSAAKQKARDEEKEKKIKEIMENLKKKNAEDEDGEEESEEDLRKRAEKLYEEDVQSEKNKKQREENERIEKEKFEKAKKEEEERKKKEEAERLKREEEEKKRRQQEKEEARKQEEEEKRRKQEEERKIEEDKKRKEQEEIEKEKRQKEEEEKRKFKDIEVSDISKTTLKKEREDTVIVNIATTEEKDGTKVSHNKYKKFSTNSNDNVILNNNTIQEVSSKISGKESVKISKNDKLKSQAADLIINEVENGTLSQLSGNLEVAGQEADVVIANKNGISVNGLKLYNVGSLSLGAASIKSDFNKKDEIFEDPISSVSFGQKFEDKNIDLKVLTNKFDNNHDLVAKNISITAKGDVINNHKNISAEDTLVLKANKVVNNESGLLNSKKDITIEAKDVENKDGTINAEKSLVIDSERIFNRDNGNIFAKEGYIRATAQLENNKSTIKAKEKLVIRTPKVLNIGQTDFSEDLTETKSYRRKTRRRESGWKSWFNGYTLDIKTPNRKVVARSKDATIESDGHLVITGLAGKNQNEELKLNNGNEKNTYKEYEKAIIDNKDAAILAKDHIYLKGNVTNTTTEYIVTRDKLLDDTKLDLYWNTQSLVDSSVLSKGDEGKGISLRDFLKTKTKLNYGVYYDLLRSANIPEVDRVLNLVLGRDWKDNPNIDASKIKYTGSMRYLSPTSRATLSAGGRILIDGDVINSGESDVYELDGKRRTYHDKESPTEYEFASQDIQFDKPQVQRDLVKLDRYIEKENGYYVKSKDKKYLYKTSDYVAKEEISVFSTLNSNLDNKVDESKVKLIGDDNYQYNMISKMLKDNNSLKLTPTKEKINSLLEASSQEANRLRLKIGQPLTKEQQSKLRRNILWYVEKEVNGEKVLTPIVYLMEEEQHRLDNQEKVVAQIRAFGGVVTTSKNFDNINSSVFGTKEVDITAEKLKNEGRENTDASIATGGKLNIKAKEVLSEMADLYALSNIDIDAKKVDIKAGSVKSGGKIKIKGKEKVLIEDKKVNESTASLENVATKNHNTETLTSSSRERSIASELEGHGIEVETEGNLTVKGSNLKSTDKIKLKGKKVDLEATKSKEKVHAVSKSSGIRQDGNLELHSEQTYERESDVINKTKLEAEGKIEIEADKDQDVNIKGTDIKGKEKVKVTGKNINIKNEVKREIVKTSDDKLDLISFSSEKTKTEDITAEKSKIQGRELEIVAKKDVNVVASDLIGKRNYVKGEQGKVNTDTFAETHKEEKISAKVGYVANAGAGAFGVGLKAEADTANRKASAEAVNEYQEKRDKFRKTGISLVNADAGVKLSLNSKKSETTKHNKSNIVAEDGFNYVIGKQEVELGGSNLKAEGDLYLEGGKVKATAKQDTHKERSTGFDLTLKQSGGTTSNIADLINVASEIDEDARAGQLNKGLAVAKGIGAATNLLFGDVAGANSRQSLSFRYKQNDLEIKEDTKTKLESEGDLTIVSKEDIVLENTDVESKEKARLQAEKDITLKAGKREEKSRNLEVGGEVRAQQTAGVSALFGANTQLGAGASVDFELQRKNNLTHSNSTVTAKNLQLQSNNNINLEGAKVRATEKASVVAKKDLNVKTVVDKIDEDRIKANIGANLSLGVASNTIGAGNISGNVGGGYTYNKGEAITERSSLTAGENLGIRVGGNLETDLATVGSDRKKGELKVGGKVITKDRELKEEAGGAIVGISGGLSGEIGLDLELADKKKKRTQHNSVIGFEKENIQAQSFERNGQQSNLENLETDDEGRVLENIYEKGGIANLNFSVKDTKTIAKAGKKAFNKAVGQVKSRRRRSVDQQSSEPTYVLRGPETGTTRTQEADSNRIYDEIRNVEPTYSEVTRPKSDDTYTLRTNETNGETRQRTESEPVYAQVNKTRTSDDTYTLAGKPSVESDSIQGRPLPKTPEGSRLNLGEGEATRKVQDNDTKRVYEEVKSDKIVVENEIYQSIDKVKRPLPELPAGSKGRVEQDSINRNREVETERIYDEIRNVEPIYSEVTRLRTDNDSTYSQVTRPKSEDPIYSEIQDKVYTLRTSESSSTYALAQAPKNRPLPELPAGSRGRVEQESIKRTTEVDTQRVYEKISPDRVVVENDLYQSTDSVRKTTETDPIYAEIQDKVYVLRGKEAELPYTLRNAEEDSTYSLVGKAKTESVYDEIKDPYTLRGAEAGSIQSRPLPKVPYGRLNLGDAETTRRVQDSDTNRIYDEIGPDRIIVENDIYSPFTSPYSLRGSEQSGFVDNPIYQSSKSLANRALPDIPGTFGKVKGEDRIYDEIDTLRTTSRRRSRRSLADAPALETPKERTLFSNPFKRILRRRARSIEQTPTVNPRAKRSLPETPVDNKRLSVESDYEQIPGLNNRRISDYATVEELNLGQTRRQQTDQSVDDLYAKINPLTKSPKKEKVETEKERNERINFENTNKYGPKQTVVDSNNPTYVTVKRTKKIQEQEPTVRKSEGDYATIDEVKPNPAKRALPEAPKSKEKVQVEGDYAEIPALATPSKAQRPLPQAPGKKVQVSDDSDYAQISDVVATRKVNSEYESIEELNLGQTRRQEANKIEDIYATVDLSKKSPKKEKVETEKERNERINFENTNKYGPKQTVVDLNDPTYVTVKRAKKIKEEESKVRKVENESTVVASKSKRALPEEPVQKQRVETEGDYAEIPVLATPSKAQRPLPQAPAKKVQVSDDSDYAQISDVVATRKVNSEYESIEELNLGQTRRQEANQTASDLYAKINPLTKSPKKEIVETEKQRNERINFENTNKFGPKRTVVDPNDPIYAKVVRGKKAQEETILRKSEDDYATIDEVKPNPAKRALPEAPVTKKTSDYATIEELGITPTPSKRSVGEEVVSKVKEFDYEDLDAIRKALESTDVEETTYDPNIKALGNTKYQPKQLSEKQKQKLFNKQKEKAAKKDPHKEAIKKLKKIAKEKNIPTEDLLRKLEELAYGYSNEDVIKYVENSAKDGTNISLPDTVDKNKLNKKDRKVLGDVFENTKFSDNYDNFKKAVDDKIFDKLSNDSKFKELINQDLAGNEKAVTELYNLVISAKKDALKELAGIDIPVPKLVLENKGHDVKYHGHYLENVVTLNIKPPVKSQDKQTLNKEILNTIIHELTHHDQANLAENKNNPSLPDGVKNESRLFGVNQDLYVTFDSHYHGYAKQPLEKDAFKSGDSLSESLIKEAFKNEELKGIGNTKYIPKQYSKEEVRKLTQEAKNKAKDRDRAKEAQKKLALLAKNSKKIPKEHLLKALEQLAYGLSYEDNAALRNKSKETNTKVHRPDTIEGFEGKNVDSFAKVFSNIKFDDSYLKVREKVNENIAEKLASNKEFHELMNQKLSGNEQGIRKLFEIVKKAKFDALYEETGIKSKDVDLEINTERGPLSFKQGYYLNNVVNMNQVPIGSFLRSKNKNNKEILDTIIHELTHHDQSNFTRNKDSKDLNPDIAQDLRLLSLNDKYYIESDKNIIAYKKQPVEREAFLSGHKLSDKLIKVIKKGYVDPNKKEINEIEHLGGKVNNLETKRAANSKLSENALIYGLKDGRKELISKANKADKNKENAILADSYLGDLNLGFEFSRLSDFAKKVNENKVSDDDIKNIAEFIDEGSSQALSDSRNRHNSVNKEDNKEIITDLLKNETAINALKKMDELNKMEEQTLKELREKDVDIDDLDDIDSYNKEQKQLIENYKAIRNGLNDTRMDFFAEKTKLIAKNTLEKGGTIYFALDGLATDSTKYVKDKTKIDFERLSDLFNPNSAYYNSVTSKEIRFLYENFKNHPNLKFTIKDQVIENPFKNLKIEK